MNGRRRSESIRSAHDVRIRAMTAARARRRPVGVTDLDTESALYLAVIEQAEALVRSMRVAKMAAPDSDWLVWHRRLGVWSQALDSLVLDYRTNSTEATDAIYVRLTERS